METQAPPCVLCRGTALVVERPYRSGKPHPLWVDRTVARCSDCGMSAMTPMPSETELDAYYAAGSYDAGNPELSEQSSRWERLPGRADAQLRFVLRDAPAVPGSWVDIGSGYGFLLDAARAAGVGRTAAVEATPSRVAVLEGKDHELIAGLDQVPAGAFDVVSMSHLLEHVPDPVSFLRRAARGLAPGGRLFCEVPNAVAWAGGHDDPHVTFFSPDTLASTLEAAGLRPTRIETAGVVVTRRRALRGAEARAWTLIKRLHPPERLAPVQPEYRRSPDGRLVIRAVAVLDEAHPA